MNDILTHLPLREPTFYILLSLSPGPKHGYAILKDVEELSEGSQSGLVIYDLELLSCLTEPQDLSEAETAIPEDAVITESGLAYKILRPGRGDRHPQVDDVVIINFTGWKSDGTMLDTSYTRGQPIGMPLTLHWWAFAPTTTGRTTGVSTTRLAATPSPTGRMKKPTRSATSRDC